MGFHGPTVIGQLDERRDRKVAGDKRLVTGGRRAHLRAAGPLGQRVNFSRSCQQREAPEASTNKASATTSSSQRKENSAATTTRRALVGTSCAPSPSIPELCRSGTWADRPSYS